MKIKNLLTSSFSKNLLVLLTGSAIGQIINILFSPILTRIFNPSEFGYLGVFTAVSGILASFTTLKLEVALPIKESDKDFNNLFLTALIYNFFISCLIGVIILVLPTSVLISFNLDVIKNWWWLFTISLFVTGVNRIFTSAVIRFKAYKSISKSFVNQILSKNLFQVLFGLINPTSFILIMGLIINQITSLYNLLKVIINNANFKSDTFNLNKFKIATYNHIDYVKYGAPASFINSLGLYLPIPLVMAFYGPTNAGSFSFGVTLISLPMKIIGTNVSQLFLGEVSSIIARRDKGVMNLYNKIFKNLFKIILVPILILVMMADKIFPFIFGLEWTDAGIFIQILSISYGLQFISSPLSQILNLLNKQKVQLLWDILRLFTTLCSFIIPYKLDISIHDALLIFSILNSLMYVWVIYLCKIEIKRWESNVLFV